MLEVLINGETKKVAWQVVPSSLLPPSFCEEEVEAHVMC